MGKKRDGEGTVYLINMNLDLSSFPKEVLNSDDGKKQLKPSELFGNILRSAIQQVHKHGSIQQLRRCHSVVELIQKAATTDGKLELDSADYKFIQSCLSQSNEWNNNETIIKVLLLVSHEVGKAIRQEPEGEG